MPFSTEDLRRFPSLVNIAEEVYDDELDEISSEVLRKYGEDETEADQWMKEYEQILVLANQEVKPKNWPWENASNVIVPLIAIAVINFSSTVYAEIIKNEKVVKHRVIGRDEDKSKDMRGERIAKYMNWQLLHNMTEWQDDTDKLLTKLALVGCCFKKAYFSPIHNRNVSLLIDPRDLVISRYTGDFDYAPRVTHKLELTYNEIIEKQRSGIYLDIDLPKTERDEETRELIEQHCWYDLDDDGYEEPYIITVDRKTKKVLRIVARYMPDDINVGDGDEVISIKPFNHFIKYTFLQPMDDSPYGIGFGKLLLPLSETANSIVNQLIDAGTISNVPGGLLGSGIRTDGGPIRIQPGEWQPVETSGASLSENVFTFPVRGPSTELLQLLQLVIAFSQDLSRSKDIMSGEIPANTPATTMLAALEQAHRTLSTIYKRIHRALSKEMDTLYDLNYNYADDDEYRDVTDDPEAILTEDFERKSFDILPIASPEISSTTQKMIKAQALIAALDSESAQSAGIDARAVWEDYLRVLGEEDIERYIPPPPPPEEQTPSIDEQMLQLQSQVAQANIQLEQQKLGLKEAELEAKISQTFAIEKQRLDSKAAEITQRAEEAEERLRQAREELDAKIDESVTRSLKNIADAEAAEVGSQLNIYKEELAALRGDLEDVRAERGRERIEGETE